MIKTNVLKTKKIAAVFMAVLMMIMSLSFTGNNTDAANTTRSYRIYNAKTGAIIETYLLNSLPTANSSRAAIGNDDRYVEQDKLGVVKIMSDDDYIGSGFVVDKHIIATAAHCAYDESTKKGMAISEILLFDKSGKNVALHATPVEVHVPVKYINYVNSKNDENKRDILYDYALITVEEDLSDYACFELGVPLDSFVDGDTNATVTVTGFPFYIINADYKYITANSHTEHGMYSGEGKVVKQPDSLNDKESLLFYEAYTSSKNSGGPVYITESYNGKTYNTVVAIHTGIGGIDKNRGTRITTDLINFYKSNDYLIYHGGY